MVVIMKSYSIMNIIYYSILKYLYRVSSMVFNVGHPVLYAQQCIDGVVRPSFNIVLDKSIYYFSQNKTIYFLFLTLVHCAVLIGKVLKFMVKVSYFNCQVHQLSNVRRWVCVCSKPTKPIRSNVFRGSIVPPAALISCTVIAGRTTGSSYSSTH